MSRSEPYIPGENPARRSGLGLPITEGPHYIARVFYGGEYCDESLEGPFADFDAAAAFVRDQHAKGYGAVLYQCTNATAAVVGR